MAETAERIQARRHGGEFVTVGRLVAALLAVIPLVATMARLAADAKAPFTSMLHYFLPYLHITYFDFGFVRRGLYGTAAHAIGAPVTIETVAALFVAGVIAFTIVSVRLIERSGSGLSPENRLWLIILFLASPATLLHFAVDAGRADIFVALLFLLAANAIAHHRPIAATGAFCASMLIHEAAYVLFAPVFVGLLMETTRGSSVSAIRRAGAYAVVPTVLFAAIYLFGGLDEASVTTIGQLVESEDPSVISDPMYPFATSLGTNAAWIGCIYAHNPLYWASLILPLIALGFLAVLFVGVDNWPRLAVSVGVLLGAAIMGGVAFDQSRYFALAMIGVWSYALALRRFNWINPMSPTTKAGFALMLLAGPLTIFSGFAVVAKILGAVSGETGAFVFGGAVACAANFVN
ncbi:MAG: hypothetical protein AAFW81_00455 [Pseudomonadota bacterium]